jgi:flagellar L-ring protein precursor FlgH
MSRRLAALSLAVLLPLTACGSISEAVNPPKITPMAYPSAIVPTSQAVIQAPENGARPASANSLWRNGARAFFHDQRAMRVGDILTVNINVNDNAKLSNETVASRTGSNVLGIPNLFGLERTLAHNGVPVANQSISTNSAFKNAGSGSVNRSEAVSLTVAAVVTGVLANGNLVIQGKQEIMINAEKRILEVAGIVRPEDITSSNTIQHTQIAEARISYGGQGAVSRVQNTPAATSLLQKFSPF